MNFTQQLWAVKEWGRVMATGNQYTSIVHEATNEEKWGPTGPQMEAVCNAYPRGGAEILSELRSRLVNRDKAWRPCYKSLLVLDFLARNVSDRYLPEICALVPLIRTISTSFYYTNPKGIDHGVSVRERARKLADLLSDGLQLREERVVAAKTREKLSHNASEGGGPNNYGAYGGSPNTYGAYGGSDEYGRRDRDRYGGAGRSGDARQSYDPYRPRSTPPPPLSRPRTKEEQERYDMELAMRMQRDEERLAGMSAGQLEEMYANKARVRRSDVDRARAAAEDDEILARRLQEEEETRARLEGRSLPTLKSDRPSDALAHPTSPPAPSAAEPARTTKPEANVLDDLFAPAPAPPTAPPTAAVDPFDTFLDSHAATEPQQPWGPSPMMAGGWGAPAPPPQQSQTPQSNAWGQPTSAPASNSWSSFPQPPQHQQQMPPTDYATHSMNSWGQPSATPQQDPWGPSHQSQPPPPQQSNSWGAYQHAQGGGWGQPSAAASALAPPAPSSSSMGDPMPGYAAHNSNANSGSPSALNNMWGTLDQFSHQQQPRK